MAYFLKNYDKVFELFLEHIQISLYAVFLSAIIGIPIGIYIAKKGALKQLIINIVNAIYTIPSLALFTIMIPIMGIGVMPSMVALVLYSLMNIIVNTSLGIESVDKNLLEAAKGMGMTKKQMLLQVEIPLSLSKIIAGIRLSMVMSISVATVASYVGGGGLGDLVFAGIFSMNVSKILCGAIPICILALVTDGFLSWLERKLSSWNGNDSAKKKGGAMA